MIPKTSNVKSIGDGVSVATTLHPTLDAKPLENSPSSKKLLAENGDDSPAPVTRSADDQTTEAQKKLKKAALFSFLFMVAEIVGGYAAGSLAIMTDAAHLLSDVAGLLMSAVAIYVSTFPPTATYTFGYQRAEVLGALLSVLFIWVVTAHLLEAAVYRVIEIHEAESVHHLQELVDGKIMFVVAVLGLLVNLCVMKILGGHSHSHGFSGHSHSHGASGHSHSHPHGHHHCSGHHAVPQSDVSAEHSHSHDHEDSHNHDHSHHHSHDHSHEEEGAAGSLSQRPRSKRHKNGDEPSDLECAPANDEHHHHDHHHHHHSGCSDHDSPLAHSEHHQPEYHLADDHHAEASLSDITHDVLMRGEGSHIPPEEPCQHGDDLEATTPHKRKRSTSFTLEKPELLLDVKEENLNVRAAYIHALGDLVQSIGVCFAGALIWYKPEWQLADPIATFLFSGVALFTTFGVLKSTLQLLMESVPEDRTLDEVTEALRALPGVESIHDVHYWSLTVGHEAVTAHLVSADKTRTLQAAQQRMRDMDIKRYTFQIEHPTDDHCEMAPLKPATSTRVAPAYSDESERFHSHNSGSGVDAAELPRPGGPLGLDALV